MSNKVAATWMIGAVQCALSTVVLASIMIAADLAAGRGVGMIVVAFSPDPLLPTEQLRTADRELKGGSGLRARRSQMSRQNLICLTLVGAVLALNATDVAACGGSREHLSAVEQARNEKAKEMQRKAVEAQDIGVTGKALVSAKQSTADADKAKELADLEARRRAEAGCGR
jgi:hypothetical protein